MDFRFSPCFVCVVVLSVLSFFNHLAEEERAGYFTLTVFLLSCGCYCPVSLRGAMFLVCRVWLWHFLVILTYLLVWFILSKYPEKIKTR